MARALTSAALAGALFAASVAAAAAAPSRVTVAIIGDSVAEGGTPNGFQPNGLTPHLNDALVARGFARGGDGYVPPVPYRWRLSDWKPAAAAAPDPGQWLLVGLGGTDAPDGPAGFSLAADSPTARASLAISDPQVTLLYTTSSVSTPFQVQAGASSWSLNAQAEGEATTAQAPLEIPAGARSITVNGPSSGVLVLDGAIGRQPVPATGTQVEISNLAHTGRLPFSDLGPRALQSALDQHYDIALFEWSYNSQIQTNDKPHSNYVAARYGSALAARATAFRQAGGLCLIADSSPLPVRASVSARYAAIDRRVARRAGCSYTSAPSRIWGNLGAARRDGLLASDNIHPTVAGYGLLARSLAKPLAALVRQR